jgi:hypothetical protein
MMEITNCTGWENFGFSPRKTFMNTTPSISLNLGSAIVMIGYV